METTTIEGFSTFDAILCMIVIADRLSPSCSSCYTASCDAGWRSVFTNSGRQTTAQGLHRIGCL